MPPVELSDLARIGLIMLLLVWAVQLFGGFAFGKLNTAGTHRIPTPLRMGSSLTLVAAAWIWWLAVPSGDLRTLALFVALGMTFGFLGDLFMARLIIKSDNHVLGGIAMFALGHVMYISGLWRYGSATGLDDTGSRLIALVVWLVVGAVAWYAVVYRNAEQRGTLHLAALPYALLLAATTGLGTGLALQSADFVPLAVGAALFLFSDLVLAAQLFSGLFFRSISDLVWLTYGPGQMLIVFAGFFSTL